MDLAQIIQTVTLYAIPVLFATGGAFLFGYAKPVPVNFGRLRHPKRDMVWVALAGPAANLLQAVAWLVLYYLMRAAGVDEVFFLKMAQAGLSVNLVLFALNMFPLPPLDGGRILVGLLPMRPALAVSRIEPFGFFIVLGLVLTGILGTYWLRPLMGLTADLLETLLTPLRWLLF